MRRPQNINRGTIYSATQEGAVLGSLVDATIQEKLLGLDGWLKVPPEILASLLTLRKEGFVEEKADEPGWWRATPKAIASSRTVSTEVGTA